MNKSINESSFIKNYLLKLTNGNPFALNLEDDVARIRSSNDLIVNTDTTIEGIHILPNLPANFIAYKAMARSFSDILAKNGNPIVGSSIGYFLNIILPKKFDRFAELTQGFDQFATEHKLDLLGGDTSTHNADTIIIVVTIIASTNARTKGKQLQRGGAQIGDCIYITKKIGEAFLGYELLKNGAKPDITNPHIKEYLMPTVGNVPNPFIVNASMDISDGLIQDANKMAQVSKCVLEIDFKLLPCSRKITKKMLSFGDDYNVFLTAFYDIRNAVKIGKVIEATDENFGVKFLNAPFKINDGDVQGFDHFQS